MNEPTIFSNPCAFCKTREAKRLCDYIVEYHRTAIFFRDYKLFKESIENGNDMSCDLPLCEECSKKINGADICPFHYGLYLDASNYPNELKKYRTIAKRKMIESNSEKAGAE